jgi:hypothetical protein
MGDRDCSERSSRATAFAEHKYDVLSKFEQQSGEPLHPERKIPY